MVNLQTSVGPSSHQGSRGARPFPVYRLENHDGILAVWRASGQRGRILVHVDAHHDMWWIEDESQLSIANFICPALREGIVEEVYWVVPDPGWKTGSGRKAIGRHLRELLAAYGARKHDVVETPHSIVTHLLDRRIVVTPMAELPQLREPVLLDVDVDFMVIPAVTFGEVDLHAPLPWCWPEQLVERVRSCLSCIEAATVAYSVVGGYTPLRWKYLGDELALRLSGAAPAQLQAMQLIRAGAEALHARDVAKAERLLAGAIEAAPELPAAHFHLALLLLQQNRDAEARISFRRAVELDPSYATPYKSGGFNLFHNGRFAAAQAEHQRVLRLDPDDAYAQFGVGQALAQQGRWREAENWLQQALSRDPELTDAYAELGEVLEHERRYDEAMSAYDTFLHLSLKGRPTLMTPVASGLRHIDFSHFRAHQRRARLLERRQELKRAAEGYQLGIAAGYDGTVVRARLARVLLKQHLWKKAARELWQALRCMPRHAKRLVRSR